MNELASGRLHGLILRLIELQPAVERYREVENLLTGLMLSAEVSEIAIPGKGRVALATGAHLVVEPDERPVGAIIEITPLKWLAPQ